MHLNVARTHPKHPRICMQTLSESACHTHIIVSQYLLNSHIIICMGSNPFNVGKITPAMGSCSLVKAPAINHPVDSVALQTCAF